MVDDPVVYFDKLTSDNESHHHQKCFWRYGGDKMEVQEQ